MGRLLPDLVASVLGVHAYYNVRKYSEPDFDQVMAIEQASFDQPWDVNNIRWCLRNRKTRCLVVDAHEPGIAGFMFFDLRRRYFQIVDIAVAYEHRWEGYGSALVTRLMTKIDARKRREILVDVRESNVLAQCFFRDLGFEFRKTLASPYDDSAEQAYRLSYEVAEPKVWIPGGS